MTGVAVSTHRSTAMPTLYEQLGGLPAVQAVVNVFSDRVLADPRLAPRFGDTAMAYQRRRVAQYVAAAAGGPAYDGRPIRDAHAHLAITSDELAAVAGHLRAAMTWLGVPRPLREELLAVVAGLAADIVTAGRGTATAA
jgi:hemoglobin